MILVPGQFALCAQRTVLLEKFSASWCPHCMAAGQALDKLVADYPNKFIPLDVFASTTGRYSQPWGLSRAFTFYNLASYPTAWFDGVVQRVGAADTYSTYLNSINSRTLIPTDVLINLSAVQTTGQSYELTLSVGLESGATVRPVQLYLVEALDHYGIYDDMSTVPRNTFWQALQSGFNLTLAPGQTRQFKTSVALDDESWNHLADVRFIAWAQAPATAGPAEIYNATQLALTQSVNGDYNHNGTVDAADYVVWRNGLDNMYTFADYAVWRAHFGQAAKLGASANAAVPEPATLTLLMHIGFFSLPAWCTAAYFRTSGQRAIHVSRTRPAGEPTTA
jgi:thiol-disulfide isomerase/thioredoxin